MKLKGKTSPNMEDQRRRANMRDNPFSGAAMQAANRTMLRQQSGKTPFNSAMDKAAKADVITRVTRENAGFQRETEDMGFPPEKRARATKFDAKKAKGLN